MIKHLIPALLGLFAAAAYAAPEDELLPPEQAFQLTTRLDGATLKASWRIAPGYYLYRDKFRFEALSPDLRLQEPRFPEAKIKQDPFFGRTAIYTGQADVSVPLQINGSARSAKVRITAQGCNEPVGVCYPPLAKEIDLVLHTAAAPVEPLKTDVPRATLTQTRIYSKRNDGVLEPDKAFRVDAAASDRSTVIVRFTIDDCCYLYRDKMRFSLSAPDGKPLGDNVRLGAYELVAGETMDDEFFGRSQVYRRGVDVRLPLRRKQSSNVDVVLHVAYQGCAEKGVKLCYPPATRQFPIHLAGDSGK